MDRAWSWHKPDIGATPAELKPIAAYEKLTAQIKIDWRAQRVEGVLVIVEKILWLLLDLMGRITTSVTP